MIGPQLPTILEVRRHNAQQTDLGACIILPAELHERTLPAPTYGPQLPDHWELGARAGLLPVDHPQLWRRADLLRRLNRRPGA